MDGGQGSGAALIGERISARMNARRDEVEQEILTRVLRVPHVTPASEPGLRGAIAAGVDFGLAGIEHGERQAGPIPTALAAQARNAARDGVALSIVLRAYFTAYTSFCDLTARTMGEAGHTEDSEVRQVLQVHAALFERVLSTAVEEYSHEVASRTTLPESRTLAFVKRLLEGQAIDSSELSYQLDDWHVGVIARGNGAPASLRALAEAADRRLLLVRPSRDTTWAWLGGRHRVEMAEIASRISLHAREDVLLALGEPARGIEGWRLTHQQADAAFRVARSGSANVVHYAEVGLLASISQDDLLARSLRELYLAPLTGGRNGGADLRETLRAYFSAGRNVSSAASALRVSRQTVSSRLRAIERRLGRTLESCAPEIEVALRLESIGEL